MIKDIKKIFGDSQLGWGNQYPANIASSIATGAARRQFTYAPDFFGANPAHGIGLGQPIRVPSVTIDMQGSRRADFAEANRLSGLMNTPRGYTWHHLFVAGGLALVGGNYQCDMQLVDSAMHRRTCAHQGSVAQWAAATGGRYRSVRAENDYEISCTSNTLPIKSGCKGAAPDVIAYLTERGCIGGEATISLSSTDVDILIHWTYGVFETKELEMYCDSFPTAGELLKIDVYPVGEDESGNLMFWHDALKTLWLYDHEGTIDPDEDSNIIDLGIGFQKIFPSYF